MTEEEQKRAEEVEEKISEAICGHCPTIDGCIHCDLLPSYGILCDHKETLREILSIPELCILHPDQSLPDVPQLATLNPTIEAFCRSTQAIMVKQGWRRVILPAGKGDDGVSL